MDTEAGMVIRGMDSTVVKTAYQTVLTAHRVWTPMLHREVQVCGYDMKSKSSTDGLNDEHLSLQIR